MSEPLRVDMATPKDVKYAVPTWLRDEQIRSNIAACKGRIQAAVELRSEPVAVVGYGPSLNQTWEQVRRFRYVISCSGAHPYLIERGIIPTWHVAVDPLPNNTVKLIGKPHPDVEYLIASTCCPDVLKHLTGHNVKLWHVFDNEDAAPVLPRGEWALFGGSDVGLRSLVIARLLGFTDLHVFGIDGSFGDTGRHAAEHPNPQQKALVINYGGKDYFTTPAMAECVRQLHHEMDQLPDVTATFYGEGLAQAYMKDYKRRTLTKPAPPGIIRPELISAEYARLNAELHKENLMYGVGGAKHAETVINLAQALNTTSVLDYGAGKRYLAKSLPFPIWEYDPAVPEISALPRPADLVVCTDVLEHVEEDKIVFVLDDLKRVTKRMAYFVIHTGPSGKTLADGRNTHLLQRDRRWWKGMLRNFFHVPPEAVIEKPPLLYIVAEPKVKPTPVAEEPQSLIEIPEFVA